MKSVASGKRQHGYLMEVPLMLMVIGIVLAILLPRLSLPGRKVVVGLAVLPVLFGLYYMMIAPGWMPAGERRPRAFWNWLMFAMAALAVIAGALFFILA
ncbi:MAG: hypothetical protein HGA75_05515 [Thiobacillus sp.]|nr:hypothetical protein [Thiobacillus sp.]